jgi:hypothetical protein
MLARVPDAPRVERGPDLAREAWQRARAVVGLYGDPTVPWSIVLQADLTGPLDAGAVRDRLAALTDRYPHLGGPPNVLEADDVDRVRAGFASRGYDGRDPLVRVALAGSPPALLLAAHHGAVDGLGLLALLGAAVDRPVRTSVIGMRNRAIAPSFALAALRRVGEAVFTPPTRVRAVPGAEPADPSEVLVAARLPLLRAGTAATTAAAAAVVREWNAGRRGRMVAAIGASRRDGDDLTPEHRAAYLRLRLPPGPTGRRSGRCWRTRSSSPTSRPRATSCCAWARVPWPDGWVPRSWCRTSVPWRSANRCARSSSFHSPAARPGWPSGW